MYSTLNCNSIEESRRMRASPSTTLKHMYTAYQNRVRRSGLLMSCEELAVDYHVQATSMFS